MLPGPAWCGGISDVEDVHGAAAQSGEQRPIVGPEGQILGALIVGAGGEVDLAGPGQPITEVAPQLDPSKRGTRRHQRTRRRDGHRTSFLGSGVGRHRDLRPRAGPPRHRGRVRRRRRRESRGPGPHDGADTAYPGHHQTAVAADGEGFDLTAHARQLTDSRGGGRVVEPPSGHRVASARQQRRGAGNKGDRTQRPLTPPRHLEGAGLAGHTVGAQAEHPDVPRLAHGSENRPPVVGGQPDRAGPGDEASRDRVPRGLDQPRPCLQGGGLPIGHHRTLRGEGGVAPAHLRGLHRQLAAQCLVADLLGLLPLLDRVDPGEDRGDRGQHGHHPEHHRRDGHPPQLTGPVALGLGGRLMPRLTGLEELPAALVERHRAGVVGERGEHRQRRATGQQIVASPVVLPVLTQCAQPTCQQQAFLIGLDPFGQPGPRGEQGLVGHLGVRIGDRDQLGIGETLENPARCPLRQHRVVGDRFLRREIGQRDRAPGHRILVDVDHLQDQAPGQVLRGRWQCLVDALGGLLHCAADASRGEIVPDGESSTVGSVPGCAQCVREQRQHAGCSRGPWWYDARGQFLEEHVDQVVVDGGADGLGRTHDHLAQLIHRHRRHDDLTVFESAGQP